MEDSSEQQAEEEESSERGSGDGDSCTRSSATEKRPSRFDHEDPVAHEQEEPDHHPARDGALSDEEENRCNRAAEERGATHP